MKFQIKTIVSEKTESNRVTKTINNKILFNYT
jgi:hypothetical protein